jgi:dTDP-4-dehydrorhamnose reductase
VKLLVFGGWGQLGSDLAIAAEGRHELVRPTRSEVDIHDLERVRAVMSAVGPDAVVNMAAFHKVERCHEEPLTAFQTNVVGALNVARSARSCGARLVYISTDYVFGGDTLQRGYQEDYPVSPVNVYGVSKAAGEAVVLNECPDSLVVRGSGMFGHAGSAGKGGNFVDNIIARAQRGEPISVVDDQMFAPTATRDMAERVLLLLERRVPPGIYHAANSGSCSWYLLAKTALAIVGIDSAITPRTTGDSVVRRPANSTLLDTRGSQLGLPPIRSWDEALAWYLRNKPLDSTVSV